LSYIGVLSTQTHGWHVCLTGLHPYFSDQIQVRPKRNIHFMARLCGLLVVLLLLLTFNAYACVLPLPASSVQMDCSSHADEPIRQTVRQTCDAFLEIGPHSQFSSNHAVSTFTLEYVVPVQLPDTCVFVSVPTPPPRSADTSTHLSIPTTVLRI